MTRLQIWRTLLALPAQDNHRRAFAPIDGYEKADREKLRIAAVRVKTKRKPRNEASSRMAFVHAVHFGKKGA